MNLKFLKNVSAQMLTALVLFGCQTAEPKIYCVQEPFSAHVPARIAVMSCLNLDDKTSNAISSALCASYNKFVTSGFTDQKFMRGYSATAVTQLLKRAKQTPLNDAWQSYFAPLSGSKKSATEIISFYRSNIQPQATWRHWLIQISKNTRLSDAILIPLIADAEDVATQDKDLKIQKKTAEILTLLIDTETGQLIWTGGRRASMSLSALSGAQPSQPTLEDLEARLFFADHWFEFPGRVQ